MIFGILIVFLPVITTCIFIYIYLHSLKKKRESFSEENKERLSLVKKKIKESKIISDLLYNFSEPEKSLILTIPLAKSAGGTAEGADKKSHPIIFKDKSDRNYAAILSAITAASKILKEKSPFCDSCDFRSTPGYVKKLKDFTDPR